MNFELAVTQGKWAGLRQLITNKGKILIGRDAACDLAIEDPLLSRQHCLLECNGEEFKLVDLKSRNGTYVNGQRIQEKLVTQSDEIRLGHHILHLQAAPTSPEIPQPTVGLCSRCQRKILQKDLLNHRAVRHGNHLYCQQCLERGIDSKTMGKLPALPGKGEVRPALPAAPTKVAKPIDTAPLRSTSLPAKGSLPAKPNIPTPTSDEMTMSDLSSSSTPSNIGQYKILEVLGEGGMGYVYKAQHVILGNIVAIKVIKEEFASHSDVLMRFLQEARLGFNLDHAHIVKILDAGEVEGTYFISMEYFAGQNLASLVQIKGTVQALTVLNWAIHLADALHYAHQKQIIHRDVKPSNILVNEEDVVKLADFGLAKAWQKAGAPQLTSAGQMLGTIQYISPEQLENSKNVDPKADIFSLAASLYFALVGVPPFGQEPLGKVIHNILHTEPPAIKRPDMPKEFEAALFKAMAKQSTQRFASMAEFRDTLIAIQKSL